MSVCGSVSPAPEVFSLTLGDARRRALGSAKELFNTEEIHTGVLSPVSIDALEV